MTAPGTVPPPVTGWWVKRNYVAFPTPAVLTLTGSAPFPSGGQRFTPAGASLTLTGSAPTVVVQVPTKATPSGGTLTLTGSAPTVTVAVAAAHYTDDFNRANSTTSVGTNWTNRLGTMGINTNAAYGVSSGESRASYDIALVTNNHSVSILVGTVQGSGVSIASVLLGLNSTGEGVQLWWNNNSGQAEIYSLASWADVGTSRATVSSVSFTTGDTVNLSRTGNVYTATKNGSSIGLSWTDSGDVVPRDSNHRLVGIATTNTSGTNYRRIDSWAADDI